MIFCRSRKSIVCCPFYYSNCDNRKKKIGIKRLFHRLFNWQYKREILQDLEKITKQSLLKVLKQQDKNLIDFFSNVELFVDYKTYYANPSIATAVTSPSVYSFFF